MREHEDAYREDMIADDEPVCINCNDEGCVFCTDLYPHTDWDDYPEDDDYDESELYEPDYHDDGRYDESDIYW